ncbi:ABC transporter ATP-binding protein [Bacillus kwashiorkori]|uniref:ABC transporter ATP-binding protein n=1 Tax=Bacillus kwashiorkori TaxID=1522318 RepID=UPI000781CBF5|nr:ABC transporter ATP-binding protein [Bacillus kwashiorkori]
MFSVLKKLNWFFKQQWKRYTIAILLLIFANIFEIIPPLIIGSAIDAIFLRSLTMTLLLQFILILFIGAIVNYTITYYWQYQLFGGAFIVEKSLRSKIMNHLLKMTPTFYEKNRTGDLMARATNDLKAVSVTAGFGILTLIDSTLYMLTILLTMGFLVSWKLTLAAVLPLPLLALGAKYLGDKIHKYYTDAQDAFGDMNDRVLENVGGIRVVRAYNQERAVENQFFQMTEAVFHKNMKVEKIDAYFYPLVRTLTGLSYCIGLAYGTFLVFQQQITLGQLVSFNVYLGMLTWPMFAIGELINVMQRGNASLDRVQETLDYKEDVSNPPHPKKTQILESIEYANVQFQYPSSSVVNLKNITIKIKQGDTIGIVGKTGSGKTTFIKQLLKEYPKAKGELLLADTPIEQQTNEHVRSWIGYVPQDQFLFSRSIKENILFGNEKATDNELENAIKLAAIDQDIHFLPNGLHTLVGEKGVALSGGQKQRISIARALIKDPEVLILDDALSAVDAKTEAKIIKNLKKARSGKTTIICTHRLSAIEHANWILVLEDGEIVEEGTHEQLLQKNGWYKEQFDRQQLSKKMEQGVN